MIRGSKSGCRGAAVYQRGVRMIGELLGQTGGGTGGSGG